MNRAELLEYIQESASGLVVLFEQKNKAYGSDDDAIYNFRETARRLETEPFEVLLTLADKHWVSLMQHGSNAPEASERLLDIAIYALIGRAMLREERGGGK